MNKYFVLSCIFLAGVLLTGNTALVAQNSSFQHSNLKYTTEVASDLSFFSGNINSVVQDDEGFMWIASWVGLFMYNGYSVRPYMPRPGFANCFMGRKIRTLYNDSKGRIWVGSSLQGLHLFSKDDQCFIQFLHDENDPNSIPENDIMGIWEDNQHNIWIGTTNGYLSKLVEHEDGTIEFMSTRFSEETTDFLSVYKTTDNVVWIGTSNGILRYDMGLSDMRPAQETPDRVYLSPNGLAENTINSIYVEKGGADNGEIAWIGTLSGVIKLDYAKGKGVYHQTQIQINSEQLNAIENRINVIYQSDFDKNHLWIGTDGGMFRINKNKVKQVDFNIIPEIKLIESDIEKVTAFCEDRSGVIWIGTNNGVRKINKYRKDFYHINLLGSDSDQTGEIKGLAKGPENKLYVATHGLGIVSIDFKSNDRETNPVRINSPNTGLKFINSVGIDKNNFLWAGTDGSGVYKINPKNIRNGVASEVEYYVSDVNDPASLSDNYIYSILSDQDGSFWIGTYQGGLNRYNEDEDNFTVYDRVRGIDNSLSDFPIVDLVQDADKNIWIGTRGNGLYYFAPNDKGREGGEVFHHIPATNNLDSGLVDNFITDIFLDSSSDFLWVGTETGISRIDLSSKKIKTYNSSNGFPGDLVQSIISIKKDEVWISSRKGVIKMELIKDKSGEEKVIYHEYSYSDGIQNKFFNNNAGVHVEDNIIFGGLNGLTIFKPSEIKDNPFKPSLALVDFELNHTSVPIGKLADGRTILSKNINELDHITLNHSDKIITFEFIALHYAAPEKNTYAFMMEGFDDDWIYTDANRRFAHYTNLPPGDYTFKIKAANNDGVWSDNSKSIKLTILPPFWTTPSAYLLYVLVFVIILLIAGKIAFQQINLRHKVELEQIERKRSDEIHNLELKYFTNISHEIRTPLTLILGPLEKVLQMPDLNARIVNQLQLMQHHGQRLNRLLNQLMDFRKQGKSELKLRVAKGNIVKFIKEIFISFRESSVDRNIEYHFDSPAESIELFYDRDILEKVFYNLLSNAFKYTSDEGRIIVSVKTIDRDDIAPQLNVVNSHYTTIFDTDYTQISITDTGHGISKEDQQHIFERFFRANSNSTKTAVGTGIGLALTKELILVHKGIISVESEIGKGSTFSAYLPVGKDHFSEDEIIKDFKDSEHLDNYALINHEKLSLDEVKNINNENSTLEKPKLLIVEDNVDVRKYIRDIFDNEYQILESANGREGLEKALEEIPDIVVSDVMMPLMDGLELCGKLKKDERTSHIPIVLLTARTSLIFKVEGIETGADDYITKPFSPKYLEARIRNLVEQRKRLKKKFSDKIYVKPKDITLNSLDESFLQKIIETIDQNMNNSEYNIEDMCKDIGMSRMQLYRKLKAITGLSANELIRTQRLQRAAQLLEQDVLNISQITYEVGFNDLKYFRSRFQEHFGMTPSDYIKKHKKTENSI